MCKFETADVNELRDKFEEFKRNDKFLTLRKSDVTVVEIPGGPIMAAVNELDFDSDVDHLAKASEQRCLALAYRDEYGHLHKVPFDLTGQESFLQRIGLNCPMFNATEGNSRYDAQSEENKVAAINTVLPLWKDRIIVLVREGMARYAGSEQSAFEDMQQADLFDVLIEEITKTFPGVGIVSGSGDNSETEVLFDLGEYDLNAQLSGLFSADACGLVRYATSDVGLRAASLFPIASIEGEEIPIGPALELPHKKPNTAAKFGEMVPLLVTAFKENSEKLEALCHVQITYPRGAFNAIAREIVAKTSLQKKSAMTIADTIDGMYPDGCNALAVYRLVASAIRLEKESRELKQDKVLQMNEALARMLYRDFRDFDHMVEI